MPRNILIVATALTISASAGFGETDHAWNPAPVVSQMRWKLGDHDYDTGMPEDFMGWRTASADELEKRLAGTKRSGPGQTLHATLAALLASGVSEDCALAARILRAQIAGNPLPDLDRAVSEHGIEFEGYLVRQESGGKTHEASEYNPQRLRVLNARDLAYEYALLYLATGDVASARRSCEILLRFAAVIPRWPHYDRNNKAHRQGSEVALRRGGPNGLWSSWYPKDLGESLPLLRAYDILRPLLSAEERETLETQIFIHHKTFIDRFDGGWPWSSYHNLGPLHLIPLLRFGQVLDKPEYIHSAIRYWDETLRYAYTPDGFWKELSPDYDQGVSARLLGSIPQIVAGYSDPEGYRDPVDRNHFDELALEKLAPSRIKRMRRAFDVFALPNGVILNVNDSWPNSRRISDKPTVPPGAPGLLGVAGLAKLGHGQMSAFLQFDGLRGHDHHDALNLVWYAAGREVFGDTGYQALPGSGSTREWHTITASHNTVAVDETTQFRNPGPEIPTPDPYHGYSSQPPASPAQPDSSSTTPEAPISAALPGAARYANQGRLLLWDATSSDVQAMEAEQEQAYLGITSLYRRTVVMVPLGNSDGYLIDLFRIRGGKTHDFLLRGGLDWPYEMTFSTPLQKATKTLYSYISVGQKATGVKPPFIATITYEGGDGPTVISHLAGAFGTAVPSDLFVGRAPAIRRLGEASFSVIRRSARSGQPLETCFVWVHEATGTTPAIKSVQASYEGMNVAVTVELDNRTDTLLSGIDDQSRFAHHDFRFTGRLAFVSNIASRHTAQVFSGGDLHMGETLLAPGRPVITGEVICTSVRDQGAPADSITIRTNDPPIASAQPKLAHIDLGEFIRYSIPVTGVQTEGAQTTVTLQHSPGFLLRDGAIVMTSFPGWRIARKATVRLE